MVGDNKQILIIDKAIKTRTINFRGQEILRIIEVGQVKIDLTKIGIVGNNKLTIVTR